MTRPRRAAVPLLALPLALLGLQVRFGSPAQGVGTVRYASPTGTPAQSCASPADACNLEKAVNSALDDDEIVLAPGTYTTATPLANSHSHLNLHGTPGQPRPVINTSADIGLTMNGYQAHVSDLALNSTGSIVGFQPFSNDGTVQRVEVHSTASMACGTPLGGVFRDSLCVSTGSGASALVTGFSSGADTAATVRLRNVTAIATGPSSSGLKVNAGNHAILTVDARNLLLSGAGHDILGLTSGTGTQVVTMQSSNYDDVQNLGSSTVTPAGTGTNQTAAPVFTDTTSYHQAASSPTVDHGTVDPDLGTNDLDGDARVVHGAPDIGVDEYVDRVAPDTVLDKTPKKRTFSHRAKFLFHATEAGSTFTCRLDKKPAAPCTSPFKKKVKKTGKHTFSVTAHDAAGNADATPATYRWKVRKRVS